MSNFRMSNALFRQKVKFFDRISISRNLFEGNLSERNMSKQNEEVNMMKQIKMIKRLSVSVS